MIEGKELLVKKIHNIGNRSNMMMKSLLKEKLEKWSSLEWWNFPYKSKGVTFLGPPRVTSYDK